jgi:hypothetical protein
MIVAIQLEERDLVKTHGAAYVSYRRRIPMLIPFVRRRSADAAPAGVSGVRPVSSES